jgi:hypothetical protein
VFVLFLVLLSSSHVQVANTRIKLQKNASAKDPSVKNYKGLVDCMERIYREEGVEALWNGAGMSPPVITYSYCR